MLDDYSIPSDEIEFNLDARAFLAPGELWDGRHAWAAVF